MRELDKLSIDVVMKLYLQKLCAEKKDDYAPLFQLETQYPDLFSTEFEDFIFNLKMTIEYFCNKDREDFSEMIDAEELICH